MLFYVFPKTALELFEGPRKRKRTVLINTRTLQPASPRTLERLNLPLLGPPPLVDLDSPSEEFSLPSPPMEDGPAFAAMPDLGYADAPNVVRMQAGQRMPAPVLVGKNYTRAKTRLFYRTKRGRRFLAKRRSLYRDAMNWRKMRAKVFNRLYTTYGRARRYSYKKKSYRRFRRRN